MRSFTSTLQSSLHPRSASVPSATLGHSQSTLTLNSNGSTQTLVPPLPTLSPSAQSFSSSTSQLSIPSFASSLTALPPHRVYPPRHLRAANNVYMERDSAAVTGAFLIDPALHVPDCLLPDDSDVLLVRGTMNGVSNGKGKQKRSNLCIVTRSGDVCVDIWVREGCARRRRRETNGSSSHSGSSQSSRSNPDNQNDSDYWQADWTSPPSSYPWPEKTEARTNIDIRSESGSITVRIVCTRSDIDFTFVLITNKEPRGFYPACTIPPTPTNTSQLSARVNLRRHPSLLRGVCPSERTSHSGELRRLRDPTSSLWLCDIPPRPRKRHEIWHWSNGTPEYAW